MGTRSMIAIQNPNSKAVKAIYCHWDGYLAHNGSILNKHYADSPKVNHLIAGGDLSSLGKVIGEKHPFSPHSSKEDAALYEAAKDAGYCTFYARDRGEDAPFKHFNSSAEAYKYFEGSWCQYFYLFKYDEDQQAGKWYYRTREDGRWKRLSTAMKKFKEDEVA